MVNHAGSASKTPPGLTLENNRYIVAPGHVTTIPLNLSNPGTSEARLTLAVRGVPPAWVSLRQRASTWQPEKSRAPSWRCTHPTHGHTLRALPGYADPYEWREIRRRRLRRSSTCWLASTPAAERWDCWRARRSSPSHPAMGWRWHSSWPTAARPAMSSR